MTTYMRRNREASASRIPKVKQRRSMFNASWSRKQTMNASFITPIMCKKVIPGSTLKIDLTNFSRLNTQVTCPIDNLQIETFFFYVPDRLVWENHKYYIGEKKNDGTSEVHIKPSITIPANLNTAGSLWNLLSASRIGVSAKVDALPFRKHNLIFNEMFRDSDCQPIKTVKLDDSDDDIALYDIYRIHKSRDYFVNSTKDMQKGDPVSIPLGESAPVVGTGITLGITNNSSLYGIAGANSSSSITVSNNYGSIVGTNATQAGSIGIDSLGVTTDPEKSGLKTLLSDALSAKLDELRQSIMTEEYLEALNRGGNKYADIMNNIYGVTIPDLTIQIPQYLGGTIAPLFTNPVIQTSGTAIEGQTTPQGNIAGYGTGGDNGQVINVSVLEFGHIMGYMVVKAQPQYQQGLDREWTVFDYLDEYNPFFNNLSDQAIAMQEIYQYDHDETDENGQLKNEKTFGYIGRFDQFRYFRNEIAGELNSEYPITLDPWHYAEKFEDEPNNNASFMEDKTYEILDRTMAQIYENGYINEKGETVITNDVLGNELIKAPQIIADIKFDGFATIPIPSHAVPKLNSSVW